LQTPTDFALDVLDPRAASALFLVPPEIGAPTTRRKYARIRAVDTGVRTPGEVWVPSLEALVGALKGYFFAGTSDDEVVAKEGQTDEDAENAEVQFILTLEPLLLGVLPDSLVPFLLIAIAVVVGLMHPGGVLERVQQGVEGLVGEARREMEEKKE